MICQVFPVSYKIVYGGLRQIGVSWGIRFGTEVLIDWLVL